MLKSLPVHLNSTQCKDLFPSNKPSNFRVRLNQTLQLDSTWRVGLADIVITSSLYTFDTEQKIVVENVNDPNLPVYVGEVKLLPKTYHSVEQLIEDINNLINGQITAFIYLDDYERVKLADGVTTVFDEEQVVKLNLPKKLIKILGLDRWGVPFLGINQSTIFVYSNIVKKSIIGNTFARLLRSVTFERSLYGTDTPKTFKSLQLKKLDTHSIDEIEIQLLTDSGKEPALTIGTVAITLIFIKDE